jgi:hypothetical protein
VAVPRPSRRQGDRRPGPDRPEHPGRGEQRRLDRDGVEPGRDEDLSLALGLPISTYLVSVAISNYTTWTDFYTPVTGGPVMPVQHWVYPSWNPARAST